MPCIPIGLCLEQYTCKIHVLSLNESLVRGAHIGQLIRVEWRNHHVQGDCDEIRLFVYAKITEIKCQPYDRTFEAKTTTIPSLST